MKEKLLIMAAVIIAFVFSYMRERQVLVLREQLETTQQALQASRDEVKACEQRSRSVVPMCITGQTYRQGDALWVCVNQKNHFWELLKQP